jgi:hypothetical protein
MNVTMMMMKMDTMTLQEAVVAPIGTAARLLLPLMTTMQPFDNLTIFRSAIYV